VPRWLPAVGFGAGVLYLALGAYGLLVGGPVHRMAPFWAAQGALFMGVGVGQYLALRRQRRREASVQTQVQDRAEPRGPGPGG
jgi:membrane protein implicated in regulation of membrane protease activity